MHVHAPAAPPLDPGMRRRARVVLTIIVVPLLVATLLGLVLLHPGQNTTIGSLPQIAPGMEAGRVRVIDKPLEQCQLPGDLAGEGANLLASAVCATVVTGQGTGLTVPVHVPPERRADIRPGTVIKVLYNPAQVSQGTPYLFWDIERGWPMALLAALYVLLVIAVAGKRGLWALVGLVASTVVLIGFIVPALMSGASPLAVTVVGSAAMLFVSVYLAHGISIRTTTALLGTLVGLGVSTSLALWGVRAATLSGATSEDALTLFTYFPKLSLSALLTCGIVIAGLGALNDVTITQASAVWELQAANPHMGRWRLFVRAMRIGSDHIASTVYTLAFAYAGTALPTLILAMMVDRSLASLAVAGDIAEEIVRTLVASIGLILAIPLTTALGTVLVSIVGGDEPARVRRLPRWRRRPLPTEANMWEVEGD